MVEQQLAEISNLQMLFASKVQEQETEIESIHNLGMRSTVHMNRAIQHLSGIQEPPLCIHTHTHTHTHTHALSLSLSLTRKTLYFSMYFQFVQLS